jgi:hypothetical protein
MMERRKKGWVSGAEVVLSRWENPVGYNKSFRVALLGTATLWAVSIVVSVPGYCSLSFRGLRNGTTVELLLLHSYHLAMIGENMQ